MSTFPSFYSHHYEVCKDDDDDDDDEDEEGIPLIENKRLNHHRDTNTQSSISDRELFFYCSLFT